MQDVHAKSITSQISGEEPLIFVGVAEGLIVVIQYWFGFALESGDFFQ